MSARDWGAWLGVGLAGALALGPSAAHAQEPDEALEEEAPPAERNGFMAQVGVGPGVYSLGGHALGTFELHLGLGAQFGQVGAIHGDFAFAAGETEDGLRTRLYSHAAVWDFIFGRFRPGLGVRGYVVEVERATRPNSMLGFGVAGVLSLGVDVVQTDYANVAIGLEGEGGRVSEDIPLLGAFLRFGGRFKVP